MSKNFQPQESSSESGNRTNLPFPGTSFEVFQNLAQQLEGSHLLEGLPGPTAPLVFASSFRQSGGTYLWLCLDNREAEQTAENLRFFLSPGPDLVLLIPGCETDPYRGLSPHPEISERRALALWKLAQGHPGFIVTTLTSLITRMPSPAEFLSNCIRLEMGRFFPLDHLVQKLRQAGYVPSDPVGQVGEYSLRGGIIDVFSPAQVNPVRVEFFGDDIESVREFDPGTQRSIGLIPLCDVVPLRESVLNQQQIREWSQRAPDHWNEIRFAETLEEKLQFVGNGELFNGFEYLFPLITDQEHDLLEFLEAAAKVDIVLPNAGQFLDQVSQFSARLQQSYEERHAEGDLVLPPEKLFFDRPWVAELLENHRSYSVAPVWEQSETVGRFHFRSERNYRGRLQDILADVSKWRGGNERVVVVTASRGMAERVNHLFSEYQLSVPLVEGGLDEALSHPMSVMQGRLSEGFHAPGLGLHLLTQENLFGETDQKAAVRRPGGKGLASKFASDFRDLKEGDSVVHMDHGVGVFQGLQKVGVGKESREFVVLRYRNDAKLYVPIDRLDAIQKYSGAGGSPQVDRLGGTSWEKTKRRVRKSMQHLAEDLLKLYARRELAQGHSFPPDDTAIHEFEEAFEYTETADQAHAIRDVKKDMESPRPMDRLICGDVGYGKTEVAMRAAFKAIMDNRQAAVLTPTTVLALQHYNTFRERFRAFPVVVEMVSRFQTRAQQKEILQRVESGLVDVLIGTHRMLSKDVHFRELGLIVVDEEQRFGVSQKERLKKLKTKVDVLALSATPIPRTLNMSLVGMRDLSIIETPPRDRLAVQTVVVKFNRSIIRSAIDLELKRQGQVFFVHNSVETIYSIANMIQETVPEARVAVGHGQMPESTLEKTMVDFLAQRYDVLVSTTIIENGLDIPSANTLIVDRADRFGLGQLYQLRGRVGRSSRRAYAYFLIPSEETLTPEAGKRLAAIKEFSDLGAGFRIAALDLEIRGAGNLLGGEQHGHIEAIGFELYMKLLEQAIQKMKGEEVREEMVSSIDLRLDIQVPEHYIQDPNQRLWLYKRISTARDSAGLENLKEEMVDRYGRYPHPVSNLFECAKLRLRAQHLRIITIERKGPRLFLKFREDTPVSREHIISRLADGTDLLLTPEGVLSAQVPSSDPIQILEATHHLLDEIAVLE